MTNVLPLFDRTEMANPESDAFANFWLLYPRHIAKRDAQKAWREVDPALHNHVLERLYLWRRVWLARGEMEFIPYPATFLRGERWEDELPAAMERPTAHASHVITRGPESGPKSEMPQHVMDLLAKLREKNRGQG